MKARHLIWTRNIMTIKKSEPHFEVLWPLGRKAVRARSAAARLPDLAGKTVGELWDYIFRGEVVYPMIREHLRARFPGIKFVDSGLRSMGHMAGELLAYMAGLSITHAPYKGTGAALFDTIAGHTDLNLGGISTTLPYVKSGRLRVIAATTAQRIAEDPEIPTIEESGLPEYDVSTWQGLIGPKGLPRAIAEHVNREIATAIRQKDIGERFQINGVSPAGNTPDQFIARIRKEIDLWLKVVARAGIGAS
jgi:tripartite-type tricarboxylate transporter receptor subunit TctC